MRIFKSNFLFYTSIVLMLLILSSCGSNSGKANITNNEVKNNQFDSVDKKARTVNYNEAFNFVNQSERDEPPYTSAAVDENGWIYFSIDEAIYRIKDNKSKIEKFFEDKLMGDLLKKFFYVNRQILIGSYTLCNTGIKKYERVEYHSTYTGEVSINEKYLLYRQLFQSENKLYVIDLKSKERISKLVFGEYVINERYPFLKDSTIYVPGYKNNKIIKHDLNKNKYDEIILSNQVQYISSLFIDEDGKYAWFIGTDQAGNNGIFRAELSSGNVSVILNTDKKYVRDYIVHNNKIYYIKDDHLFVQGIDGSNKKEVSEYFDSHGFYGINIYGNNIYFISNEKLYRMDLNNDSVDELVDIKKTADEVHEKKLKGIYTSEY